MIGNTIMNMKILMKMKTLMKKAPQKATFWSTLQLTLPKKQERVNRPSYRQRGYFGTNNTGFVQKA